jgi:hypothetical protein
MARRCEDPRWSFRVAACRIFGAALIVKDNHFGGSARR